MRLYNDIREFPLLNYERVMTTGNYFFVLKGYDFGIDTEEFKEEDVKVHFQKLIEEYIISVDNVSIDFLNQGKIQASRLEILKLDTLIDILHLKIEANKIRNKQNRDIDNSIIDTLFEKIQIRRSADLKEQISIIKDKIEKHENDILSTESKMSKKSSSDNKESDVNDIIVSVEQILERSINMEDTSLYRFGVMMKLAKNKIEHLNKMSKK